MQIIKIRMLELFGIILKDILFNIMILNNDFHTKF